MKPALLTLLITAACAHPIQVRQINPEPHPLAPRSPESVEVFANGPPARPHVDVRFLEATNADSSDQAPDLVMKLRAKAAEIGCDGLVLGRVLAPDIALRNVEATCIVYNDVAWGPEQMHQACEAGRYAIYQRMKQTANHDDRVRLLQLAPHCDAPAYSRGSSGS